MRSHFSTSQSGPRAPSEAPVRLPASIGKWSLKPGPRVITAKTIFDYMDGAGELYLAYRFRQLDVYEYSAKGGPDILVELYWMETSDDAFGLLSGDWGGEAVKVQNRGAGGPKIRLWPRALYGAGLLRIWSDNLYARVLAQNEDAASRKAVLGIGSAIVQGRRDPPPPRLAAAMPATVEPAFRLREDRLCYFRSHLVLNSAYFLATSNILELGPQTEAVTAPYAGPARAGTKAQARLLVVSYRHPAAALKALARFSRTYLPERKPAAPQVSAGARSVLRIEDGWLGYQNSGPFLVFVFECPSREAADAFLTQTTRSITGMEGSHE
ncbi:MAG: hypothetical protein HXY20_07345 [Acidobacteria bacterium]|nr:hypothetical protein [Acidobacteriota bacterium]